MMKQGTLCILVKDTAPPQVLLGRVKRSKLQKDVYNFPGGKYKAPETMEQCASRELYEETSVRVKPENLRKVAELTVIWPKSLDMWNQLIHVYTGRTWSGEPQESDEMLPQWFLIADLPLQSMWAADRLWVPPVFQGQYVTGRFVYNKNRELTMHDVRTKPF
jgi:8-oxo-dGTP diphosphatase